jgi:hypothetical protein
MATGGFFGILPAARGSGNAGANSMFLTLVTASSNATATAVLIDTPSATGSISFKAVVYDAAHSALLATGSAVTSVALGYNRLPLTANLSLTAGTSYYVGYVCNSSCSVTIGATASSSSWFVSGGQSVPTPANPLVGGSTNGSCLQVALELDGTGTQGYGYSVDQSAGVTLSALNTVATLPTSAEQGARSLVTQALGASGNLYAEIAISGSSIIPTDGIGIAAVAWGPGQTSPGSSYLWVLQANGNSSGGASASLGLPWAAGDVVGMAYNPTTNTFWWNKNNGSWFGSSSTAGNPVTGTGGLALGAGNAWPMALSVLSQSATGTNAAFTLRDFAASLQYAPPSGYVAWSPYVAPVLSSQVRAMVLA